MKTLTTILFAVLLMAGTYPAAAQHQHGQQKTAEQPQTVPPSQDGMMQGGMMQGGMMQGNMMQGNMMGMMHQMHMQMMDQVMSNPLKQSAMLVQVLPTMTDPLGLKGEQITHIEEAARQFKKQQATLKDNASKAEAQLKDMLASERPDPAMVKSLLRETSMHRADMKALGLETATQMLSKLTEEQHAKLAAMTPMQMHHHMATHMTMMAMMQAMHSDMMSGGMMAMMQANNMQGKMMKEGRMMQR